MFNHEERIAVLEKGVMTGSAMQTSFAVPSDCFVCTVTRPLQRWFLLRGILS